MACRGDLRRSPRGGTFSQRQAVLPPNQNGPMIDLYNQDTGTVVGSITDADLKLLMDNLEETAGDDQDYYITQDTIDMLGDGQATDHLLGLLRTALGSEEGVDIRWERRP